MRSVYYLSQIFYWLSFLLTQDALMARVLGQRKMSYTGVNVRANPKYFTNVSYSIVDYKLSIDMALLKEVSSGFRATINMQIRLADSTRYQSLFRYDFDFCNMINQLFRLKLIYNWYQNVVRYGNLKENCPVEAGHYYVHNFVLEPSSIPVYLRPGDYRIIVHCYFGKRTKKLEIFTIRFSMDMKLS